MYHEGMRELQDRYGGRKVADALEKHRKHVKFTPEDKQYIEELRRYADGNLASCYVGAIHKRYLEPMHV